MLLDEGVKVSLQVGPAPPDADCGGTATGKVELLEEGFGDAEIGGGLLARVGRMRVVLGLVGHAGSQWGCDGYGIIRTDQRVSGNRKAGGFVLERF